MKPILLLLLVVGTVSVSRTAVAAPAGHVTAHVEKLAHKAGAALGLGAGEVVTAGLGLSKTWSAPLMKDGQQATLDVKGFHYGLEVRNQSVVGPKVQAYANKMPTQTAGQRIQHAFVDGLATGATAAPMKEAHLEATVARLFAERPSTK